MREIKFRFWDAINRIIYPDMGRLSTQGINEWFSKASTSDVIPMQYTGLKDINGKEIYEGDLVVFAGRKSNPKAVEWFENGFYLSGVSHSQIDGYALVVGNIYETPELLGGDKV